MSEPSEPDNPKRSTAAPVRRRIFPRIALLFLLAIGGLYMMSFTAKVPAGLGQQNGKLSECPDSPNCVSSQTDSAKHKMEAISFTGELADAVDKLKSVISSNCSRARLVEEQDDYLRFEFTSLIFRFVDDVEFVFDDSTQQIHFRSASRAGHSDLGANRKRMKKIAASFTSGG